MKKIRAEYTIVTPMFLGGADQSPMDGIRPPSVKGALRFWWRALNWKCYQEKNTEIEALRKLHQKEAQLFGSAISDNKGGQGCFLLSVKQETITSEKTCNDWPPSDPNHEASYMAYGLLETNDEPHRIALKEGHNFTLQLAFKPDTTENDYQQIKIALETWSLMGGLGGRSRRAMGSITLTRMNGTPVLYDQVGYKAELDMLFSSFKTGSLAPYTALNKESDYRIVKTSKNARTLVKILGRDYKAFRGTLGGSSKVPFGLPLQDVDLKNRRSSPLFFHLHQLSNNMIAATLIYLPAAIFHPDYKNLSMHEVKAFLSAGIN